MNAMIKTNAGDEMAFRTLNAEEIDAVAGAKRKVIDVRAETCRVIRFPNGQRAEHCTPTPKQH